MDRRALVSILIVSILLGCASGRMHEDPGVAREFVSDPESMKRLHLDLVARLIDRGQPLAALAHLDALVDGQDEDEVRFLRAESLRRAGRDGEAADSYRALANGSFAGVAFRGLGLIEARRGRFDEAIRNLMLARDARPTDPQIRNDLGYALLRAADYRQARVELGTAVELTGGDAPPVRNLILLLLILDQRAEADAWLRRAELDAQQILEIRARAAELREEHSRRDSEIFESEGDAG